MQGFCTFGATDIDGTGRGNVFFVTISTQGFVPEATENTDFDPATDSHMEVIGTAFV